MVKGCSRRFSSSLVPHRQHFFVPLSHMTLWGPLKSSCPRWQMLHPSGYLFTLFTPQMLKSLKKTMSAALSDISIEWLFPEAEEVLLSPVGNTFLFPGDSLIGYSVVCDTNRYYANPKSVSDIFTYFCLSC